ncbi:MAG TPA: hypothetical protein PLG73_09060 [Candidatus Sumerlaeota bacterium]|nr:hypothetical protein [Candidatus Sumerlaeota bacterium]
MAKTGKMEVLVRQSDGEIFPYNDTQREQYRAAQQLADSRGEVCTYWTERGFRVETQEVTIGEQPKPEPEATGELRNLVAQLARDNQELRARLEALEGTMTVPPPPEDPANSSKGKGGGEARK